MINHQNKTRVSVLVSGRAVPGRRQTKKQAAIHGIQTQLIMNIARLSYPEFYDVESTNATIVSLSEQLSKLL